MNKYDLLLLIGQLDKALEDCTNWFVLSRVQSDREKREIYSAIYEAKNRTYLNVLKEVCERLKK